MLKPTKINEWVKEVEERPLMAPFIIRRISDRLFELDAENERLRADNLALETGKKVQEYERRISDLEYQLELLKRQVQNGGEVKLKTASLLIYDSLGRVLAREVHAADLVSGEILTTVKAEMSFDPEEMRMLVVDPSEEILFVFDTGKVMSLSAEKLPLVSSSELNQENIYQVELRSGERLIALVPVSQVPLVDHCVQISRRGLAKSITADYFQMFVTNRNIGTGVKSKSDRNFNLTLCNQDDIYVVVSLEGFLAAFIMDQFSVSARNVIKLGMNDFLVSSFIMREEQSLAVVTRGGDVFMQAANWLSAENATGSKRRLLLSKSKAGGMQVVSAEAVKPGGWGFILYEDGAVRVLQLEEDLKLLRDKSKKEQKAPQAVAFTATELFLTDK